MRVEKPSSRRFDAVNVNGPLGQREKRRLLKETFSLSVVDDLQSRICILKLAACEQPGTEWVQQPFEMTLIQTLESELCTQHELNKLSSFSSSLLQSFFATKV